MTQYKVKRVIQFLMPTLIVFNYFILLDYYVFPSTTLHVKVVDAYIEEGSKPYLVDANLEKHLVDYLLYVSCTKGDMVAIEVSPIFKTLKSYKIQLKDDGFTYSLNGLKVTIFMLSVLFIGWLIFKNVHEYFYYVLFIPYLVMNIYFWAVVLRYRF